MKTITTTSLALLSCTMMAGCSLLEQDADLHVGYYTFGFEVNAFTPCGAGEPWWVTSDNTEAMKALKDQFFEVVTRDGVVPFVVLKGRPSKPGRYGHLEGYEREFELEDVISVRSSGTPACPRP